MQLRRIYQLGNRTVRGFGEHDGTRLSAAIAYYSLVSLAPLLLIAVSVAGMVFDEEAARGQITATLGGLVGEAGASAIEEILENASSDRAGMLATIIGIAVLLLGASGVFGELKDSLNTIWEVKRPAKSGIMTMLRKRFLSFTFVLGTGFLLLVSLLVSTALSAAGTYVAGVLPGGEALWQIVNLAVSFVLVTCIFAILFKKLPDTPLLWSDVRAGAAVTALLFLLGQFVIGLYLGKSSLGSAYGAAGSVVVLLVWLYYTGIIFFLGAEFTKAYAHLHGSRIRAARMATATALVVPLLGAAIGAYYRRPTTIVASLAEAWEIVKDKMKGTT